MILYRLQIKNPNKKGAFRAWTNSKTYTDSDPAVRRLYRKKKNWGDAGWEYRILTVDQDTLESECYFCDLCGVER